MNSRVIREITTDPWWTSYDILHLPCDDKIKGVATGVGRPSHMLLETEWFQKIHNFYCISVGRDIHVARVRVLASTPYVGQVCCLCSPLLREVFLRVLWFSPLLKNQPTRNQVDEEPLSGCVLLLNRYSFILHLVTKRKFLKRKSKETRQYRVFNKFEDLTEYFIYFSYIFCHLGNF